MAPRSPLRGNARPGAAVGVHRMAVLTAGATLALIFVGGVVTNTGSALAVPDWPTTFGYPMFLYPWSRMVGGILYEHSHRLIGSLVGVLTVALAVGIWRAALPRRVRVLGLIAVAAVIAQGVLGGLRVVLLQNTLGVVHGVLAQTFFALIAALAVLTSREWAEAPLGGPVAGGAGLRRLSWLALGLIYLQIVLGAIVTHQGLGLHVHLMVGGLVAILLLWLAARILGSHGDRRAIARPARLLAGLVTVQLFLGLGSYLSRFTALGPAMPVSAALAFPLVHRLGGALLLGTALVLALHSSRLAGARQPTVGGRRVLDEVPA